MKLFKNEVGRPSNETLKKRRMVIIGIIAAAVLLVGGVTFALVKAFKPVEGVGHNAQANKFVVVKNSDTCYTVYAPSNAKNWAVHVYYKQTSSSGFGNKKIASLSKYHDNDGVKQQKICFTKQAYENETFRILVKWTQGKNHKTYGKVSNWKPNGYYANNAIGWAYKDYKVSWSGSTNNSSSTNNGTTNNSSSTVKPALTITQPSLTTYKSNYTVTIKVKHNQNKTMYYTFQNYNKGIAGYKQKCTPIKAGVTKSFTLDVNSSASTRKSIIKLYSDSKCSNLVDTKQTNVYYYEPLKLVLSEPSQKVFPAETPDSNKVKITVTAKTNYNTLFYKFSTYENVNGKDKLSYQEKKCIPINANTSKSFTMDVNKNYKHRHALVALYTDSSCKNYVDSYRTSDYIYLSSNETANALSIVKGGTQACYTSPTTQKITFKNNLNAKAYYKYITYSNESSKINTISGSGCIPIDSKATKDLSIRLTSTRVNYHASITLYYDSSCKTKIKNVTGGTYKYRAAC